MARYTDAAFFRFFAFCLLGIAAACAPLKPVSEQNMAHLYSRNAPVSADFSLAGSPEEVLVFCRLSFQFPEFSAEKPGFWDQYSLEYQLRPGFESSRALQRDSVRPDMLIRGSGLQPVFQISFPRAAEDRVLFLKIRTRFSADEYGFTCRIPGDESGELSPFALFSSRGKIPVSGAYAKAGDTLFIRSFDYRKDAIRVDFSPFSPAIAMPPMATMALLDTAPQPFYPVSIRLNEARIFRQPGYYLVRDSSGSGGFGFAIGEGEFPRLSTAQELISPMVYISTREERKAVQSAENPKLALDQFWLKISPQKDRARELIKRYFLNIEEANRHFTIAKEGWKTDRGMVMAIFGPPYQVFRTQDAEVWIYDKGHGPENSVFYFFRKRADNFADIWELKRLGEYDKVWYGVVDLWRKGLIDR